MQQCSTAGPNAHNQIGPRVTAACVLLRGLDNSLTTQGSLAIPFKTVMLALKSGPFRGPQNFSSRAAGCTPLVGLDQMIFSYSLVTFYKPNSLSHSILFSIMCKSTTGRIMMNRVEPIGENIKQFHAN